MRKNKKKELRWLKLKEKQLNGEIFDLERQKTFSIDINGFHICSYISDYNYIQNGIQMVEDVKGMKRGSAYAMFRLKKKLMFAIFNIVILET